MSKDKKPASDKQLSLLREYGIDIQEATALIDVFEGTSWRALQKILNTEVKKKARKLQNANINSGPEEAWKLLLSYRGAVDITNGLDLVRKQFVDNFDD